MHFNIAIWIPVLLLHFLPSVNAVYIDEAYQSDYHHALLGAPLSHATFFHRPTAASRGSLLYSLSRKRILGAINPKDGSVVWRQKLAPQLNNMTSNGLLTAYEGLDVIVSAIDGTIQAWDAADGRLAWEWRFKGKVKALEIFGRDGVAAGVYMLAEDESGKGTLWKISRDTGEILWQFEDGSSGDSPFRISVSVENVYYISLHSAPLQGHKIRSIALNPLNGESKGQTTLSSVKESLSEDLIYMHGAQSASPLVLWTDSSFTTLKVNLIGTKQIMTGHIKNTDGDAVRSINIHTIVEGDGRVHILCHCQASNAHWAEIWNLESKSGTLSKAYDLPQVQGLGSFSTGRHDNNYFFIRNTETEISLLSSDTGKLLSQWPISSSLPGRIAAKDIHHTVSEVVARGQSSFAVRSARASSPGDWELVRNGELVWYRPESLTGIVAAAWADLGRHEELAQELALEGHAGAIAAYLHRFRRHVRDMKRLLSWIRELPDRSLSISDSRSYPGQRDSVRDSFGFRKLIIVATKSGRLAALDTGIYGAVIWNIQAVDLSGGRSWDVIGIEPKDGFALVRATGGEYLKVEILTGKIMQHQPGGLISSLKTSITTLDKLGQELQFAIHDDGSLGDIRGHLRPESIIVTQNDERVVRGWSVDAGSHSKMAWEFAPMSGERIVDVVIRPRHDPVASIGKALGDRNVLYKYLNRNIMLLSTVTDASRTARFYLLDAASGAIIYSTRHSGVDLSKPITCTISENWFVYSLFSVSTLSAQENGSPESKGYELIASEILESPIPNDRGPLGAATNTSGILPGSADNEETIDGLYVVSQSYQIPGAITSMSTTSTLQGITPRSLLCVVPSIAALVAIPRAMFDPRRPVGRDPTPAEAEEGLFRHLGILEFEPKWVINHVRDILGIASIITSPSLLESTSLLFAFGEVDLFGTRVAPIGGFDILGRGFSKLQLVGTVVALAVGTGLLGPMARKKQINSQWKGR